MSAYDDYLTGLFPSTDPIMHYKFDETSGTSLADSGLGTLALTTNGSVTLGASSLLDSDATMKSIDQDKDTILASRADNGLIDRPTLTSQKISLIVWFRPYKLKSIQTLLFKGNTAVYGLTLDGTTLRGDAGSTSSLNNLNTPGDLILPGNVYMGAFVADLTTQSLKVFVNGVVMASRTVGSGLSIPHSSGGNFQIGGYNGTGPTAVNGFSGRIGRCSVFSAHSLSDAQVQEAYRLGVTQAAVETAGGTYVFPWSRKIVDSTTPYTKVQFVNGSDTPIWLSRSSPAAIGAGEYLAPRGGQSRMITNYTGDWYAIHEAVVGGKVIAINKT